jgi:hypothetical protein
LKGFKHSSKNERRAGRKNESAIRRIGEWSGSHSRASRGVQRTARPTLTVQPLTNA